MELFVLRFNSLIFHGGKWRVEYKPRECNGASHEVATYGMETDVSDIWKYLCPSWLISHIVPIYINNLLCD